MKVAFGLSNPSVAVPSPGQHGATGDERHLQWRAELERAQWQARLRYAPMREDARGSADAQPVARTDAALTTPRDVRTAWDGFDPASIPLRALARDASQPVRAQGAQPATGMSQQTRAPVVEFASLSTWAALQGLRSDAPTPVMRPAALLAMLDPARWPPHSAQVSLSGNRLSVVLRDAQIDESDHLRLHERLRAACERCGLELAALTINGVPVDLAAPTSNEGA